MRIKTAENGNVTIQHQQDVLLHNSTENQKITNLAEDTTNCSLALNCNIAYNSRSSLTKEHFSDEIGNGAENNTLNLVAELICNRQYRINSRNVNTERSSNFEPLEETVPDCIVSNNIIGNTNAYEDNTPIDEEKAFEHSDTDEMCENGVQTVPRGIVNPNYPGFQHLAHTLQDYSSSIDNFYHSENEMTDDDVDIEITDLAYESDPNKTITLNNSDNNSLNNNNSQKEHTNIVFSKENEGYIQSNTVDSQLHNEIPDLLKTVSKNNNNYNEYFLTYVNCTDTDIENNFQSKDIIGDFNKEIEDEIKQLLNYNINIQDDLEELRKDIKDTFSKPIENTINNISDVVNQVIKKLVETQSDGYEFDLKEHIKQYEQKEMYEIDKQNERNTRTEMNLSRPTFLLIDHNTSGKISDAFLSDGKDEINIDEYNTEKLSLNVENTIKQLSTELRKIIPKLDEMRERDRLWAECGNDTFNKDGNSNELANNPKVPSPIRSFDSLIRSTGVSKSIKQDDNPGSGKLHSLPTQNEYKAGKEKKKDNTPSTTSYRPAKNKISVRKNDNANDLELGSFDVYNIETALPKLDIDAIETHLKAAKEAERRNLVTNIRRKFSKTSEQIHDSAKADTEKSGSRRSLFKIKLFTKSASGGRNIVENSEDKALSPRAVGSAECALTEIEWPNVADQNPNILDKFTRIVNVTEHVPYDKNKRNDREEIRRRLALGADTEEYYSLGYNDRPGKKPSLHSRLQSGMNLQICFMNETASDNESQASDLEKSFSTTKSLSRSSLFSKSSNNHPYQTRPLSVSITKHDKISTAQSGAKLRPSSLSLKSTKSRSTHSLGHIEIKESDFYVLQATLQTEARIALAQAKEMARIQMERERRSRAVSPVTEMLRRSMMKANAPLAPDRRRVSRQLLTDMNIAQLQVIVNELHSQIESLNDSLVKLLMARDELHMGQDSMLVDIEDLTRYLGVKEQTKKTKGSTNKSGMKRLTSLVNK